MVKTCSASNCTSIYEKGVSVTFYRFPLNDPELLSAWTRAIRRDTFKATRNHFLCSKHFDDDCFLKSFAKRKKLVSKAVPTKFNFPDRSKLVCTSQSARPMEQQTPVEDARAAIHQQPVKDEQTVSDGPDHTYAVPLRTPKLEHPAETITESEEPTEGAAAVKWEFVECPMVAASDDETPDNADPFLDPVPFAGDRLVKLEPPSPSRRSTDGVEVPSSSALYSCARCNDKFAGDRLVKLEPPSPSRRSTDGVEVPSSSALYSCARCNDKFADFRTLTLHEKEHDQSGKRAFEFVSTLRRVEGKKLVRPAQKSRSGMDPRGSNAIASQKPSSLRKLAPLFTCATCGVPFYSKRTITLHMQTHGESFLCKCSKCVGNFAYNANFYLNGKRRDTVNGIPKLRHIECKCDSSDELHPLDHVKLVYNPEEDPTPAIPKDSMPSASQTTNSVVQPTNWMFPCDLCGAAFVKEKAMLKHMLSHREETDWKCSKCGKMFPDQPSLASHERQHLIIKFISCVKCEAKFGDKGQLTRHMNSVHGKGAVQQIPCARQVRWPIKSYDCVQCGESFANEKTLWIHLRTHAGLPLFKCSRCNELFADKAGLKLHAKKHDEGRTFVCGKCGEIFTKVLQLLRHMKSHPGEAKESETQSTGRRHNSSELLRIKLSKCAECGKSFLSREEMLSHAKSHAIKCQSKCT